ncbi:hypothetical protein NECAME_10118 [Necator americanus]|uniref:Uncharacterized protein n=1 Tax=Necator americanus TaxID=51031 RepID=W2TAG0_NECAM|nr:hypothetical protein NECAME_10118 [Necator americanus]ETN78818.1 hypothetical protein NECAME_10118 [Necator americanus]
MKSVLIILLVTLVFRIQCAAIKEVDDTVDINRRLKRVIQLGPPPVSPDCPTSPLFSGGQPLPPPPGCPPPLSPSRSSKQSSMA